MVADVVRTKAKIDFDFNLCSSMLFVLDAYGLAFSVAPIIVFVFGLRTSQKTYPYKIRTDINSKKIAGPFGPIT